MNRLAIIGSGDLAEQIAYHAWNDNHYQPVGYFDDYIPQNTIVSGLPILGSINDIETMFSNKIFDILIIGIGYKHFDLRQQLYNFFEKKIPFGRIIHSSAYVEKNCVLEPGVCIFPGCVLDSNVIVKQNVLMNVGSVVAHDTEIGAHSFLSPAVNVAGFVKIGQRVNIGIGTVIIDNITIGDDIRTGGGAVVVNNLEQPGLYVGIPAHFIK